MITSLDQIKLAENLIAFLVKLRDNNQLLKTDDPQKLSYTNLALLAIAHLEDIIGRTSDGKVIIDSASLPRTHLLTGGHTDAIERFKKSFEQWTNLMQHFVYGLNPISISMQPKS